MTDPRPERITPPWDAATVTTLNAFQHAGRLHPFTCGLDSRHVLLATPDGWVCEHDDYRQDWAHRAMTDPALCAPWSAAEFLPPRPWHDIDPADAATMMLPMVGIVGPVNEEGYPCPWPWEPQQMLGAPIGQYRCTYCDAMVLAGVRHLDYRCLTEDA